MEGPLRNHGNFKVFFQGFLKNVVVALNVFLKIFML